MRHASVTTILSLLIIAALSVAPVAADLPTETEVLEVLAEQMFLQLHSSYVTLPSGSTESCLQVGSAPTSRDPCGNDSWPNRIPSLRGCSHGSGIG